MSRWWNRLQQPVPCDVTLSWGRCTVQPAPGLKAESGMPDGATSQGVRQALHSALDSAAALTSATSFKRVRLWVGSGLCTQGVIAVDAVETRRKPLEQALQAYWADLMDVPADALQVAYAVQPGGRSVVSSCCPAWLPEVAREVARAHGARRIDIAPAAVRAWNSLQQAIQVESGVLAVHGPDGDLELGAFSGPCWTTWESDAGLRHAQAVETTVSRFLRMNGIADSTPVWLCTDTLPDCGVLPAHWTTVHDRPQELV